MIPSRIRRDGIFFGFDHSRPRQYFFIFNPPLMKSKIIVTISILFLLMASCKKDKASKTELLTQSSWIYQDAKRNGISIFASVQPCVRDNVYTFKTSGELTIDEGSTKCSSGDPQTANFPWFFFSNEDSISINGFRTKVLEISKTQFISEQTNLAGDKYVYYYGH